MFVQANEYASGGGGGGDGAGNHEQAEWDMAAAL